jgi:HEAT repeat protein
MLTNPAPAADVIRGITPLFATDSLVERLGEEQDRSRRKGMIDALAAAAAHDPKPLLKHLDDDRWYVVRNVVVILGRSGDPRIVGRLRDSLRHPEPRVRRETLRALFALQGDASVPTLLSSLDDPDVSVRRSALFLLRSPSDPAIDEALDARLSGDGELEEKLKIIDTLAARSVPTAREVLRRRASVHVALTNTTRILRGAARTALKGET